MDYEGAALTRLTLQELESQGTKGQEQPEEVLAQGVYDGELQIRIRGDEELLDCEESFIEAHLVVLVAPIGDLVYELVPVLFLHLGEVE